jgi:hypothetical protein
MGKGNCHGKGFTEVEDFVCRVIAERASARTWGTRIYPGLTHGKRLNNNRGTAVRRDNEAGRMGLAEKESRE